MIMPPGACHDQAPVACHPVERCRSLSPAAPLPEDASATARPGQPTRPTNPCYRAVPLPPFPPLPSLPPRPTPSPTHSTGSRPRHHHRHRNSCRRRFRSLGMRLAHGTAPGGGTLVEHGGVGVGHAWEWCERHGATSHVDICHDADIHHHRRHPTSPWASPLGPPPCGARPIGHVTPHTL